MVLWRSCTATEIKVDVAQSMIFIVTVELKKNKTKKNKKHSRQMKIAT